MDLNYFFKSIHKHMTAYEQNIKVIARKIQSNIESVSAKTSWGTNCYIQRHLKFEDNVEVEL